MKRTRIFHGGGRGEKSGVVYMAVAAPPCSAPDASDNGRLGRPQASASQFDTELLCSQRPLWSRSAPPPQYTSMAWVSLSLSLACLKLQD